MKAREEEEEEEEFPLHYLFSGNGFLIRSGLRHGKKKKNALSSG